MKINPQKSIRELKDENYIHENEKYSHKKNYWDCSIIWHGDLSIVKRTEEARWSSKNVHLLVTSRLYLGKTKLLTKKYCDICLINGNYEKLLTLANHNIKNLSTARTLFERIGSVVMRCGFQKMAWIYPAELFRNAANKVISNTHDNC